MPVQTLVNSCTCVFEFPHLRFRIPVPAFAKTCTGVGRMTCMVDSFRVLEARHFNNPILRPIGRSVGWRMRRWDACRMHATT